MQIVIDIQDEIKNMCDNAKPEKAMQGIMWFNGTLYKAIKEGIVLPKGHGRLICRPTMEEIEKTIGGKNDFADCIRDGVEAVFYNAQTVVPADKEDAE